MSEKEPKAQNEDEAATLGVDMGHIKELMGPLPFEAVPEKVDKKAEKPKKVTAPKTAPVVIIPKEVTKETVSSAAEEANASLKSMSPNLGEATITKVDENKVEDDKFEPSINFDKKFVNEDSAPENVEPIVGEGVVADDPAIVKAVNDIVSQEGDEILEAEDQKRENIISVEDKKQGLGERFKELWARSGFRWGLAGLLVAGILVAGLVPTSRYYILNNVGVRASLTVAVVDNSTQQPLKNVYISVAGVSAQTDSSGNAKLEHLKLGPARLTVSKRAFTTISQSVTVGWGSNPEGQLRLAASGTQYTFQTTDYLSGKPIEKVEASSGDGNAVSDKNGRIVLSLDTSGKNDSDEITIQISAANYRSETLKITASNKETNAIKLVPARKDVFISKRSGKYDIYTIDIDGKNEQKIIAGTGVERDDIALAPQQNGDIVAYVATRENTRNSDGYLLSTLYMIDIKSSTLVKVDQSEQIQLVGWSSDQRLVYVKIASGSSGANPKRHRLVSVSSKNVNDSKEIASANAFNDVLMSGDTVYYAPSNALQDNPHPGLFSVKADNTSLITIINKEVFNIFRTDYETITMNASGTFYSYKLGAAPSSIASSTAPNNSNRLYIDNISNARSLWVDNRDGKGLLISYDKSAKKETTLVTKAGVKIPTYWLNDTTAIFRVNDGKETADYAVSSDGGDAKKIQDVTDVSGIGRWYYY